MSMYKSPKTHNELIKRSFEIIEQYSKLEESLEDKYYDVTLTLACFTSVIACIRESCLNNKKNIKVESFLLDTVVQDKDKIRTIKDYIVGLRNGLCHGDIEFKDDGNSITILKVNGSFDSYNKKPVYEFNISQEKNPFRKLTKYLLDTFYTEE